MTTELALEPALERALAAWLAATATHGITLTGYAIRLSEQDDSDNLTLPAITLKVEREAEDPAPGTGVWRCRVTVAMLTQAQDTATTAVEQDWHNLMSLLLWDDLAARLSDASGLRVYSVIRNAGTMRDVAQYHWSNSFIFTVWAVSQD